MFDYKIKLNRKKLEESDEDILVCFLKMLDFSAEYLYGIYEVSKIKFCPEEKLIYLNDRPKHSNTINEISKSYGFNLSNQ